ncbi:MAG TPA: penicillin-binding protein 1C, partial [Ferruginibacter sp.]|nr:penicillin-binding protein 1C [Ferruginibacter sp.]
MFNNKINIQFISLSFPVIAILIAIPVIVTAFYLILPVRLFTTPSSYVLEDENGVLLNASIAKDGQWRFPHNPEIPGKFIECITTFEDKRFFNHPGTDLLAIARAAIKNCNGSHQGGSTLTMQVIRMAMKNNNRTWWNKLKESVLALRLEYRCSKKEILALYASNAPFGSNVVGLDAAAWRYYGRNPDKLSWAEMATLAVLPNAPSLVHPGKNRQLLLNKRNKLLLELKSGGKITGQDYLLAIGEPLPLKPLPLPQYAPHLLQRFAKEHRKYYKATTTLRFELQQKLNTLITQRQQQYSGNGINNICALVLDVQTGNTLAYVGNSYNTADKDSQGDVDIITAERSPGSALKPLLYAAMLSDGLILPGSLVPDIPTQIAGYTPLNFDKGFDGAVPAGIALSRSLNVPAVRLLQQYKYQRFYETLKQCGINTLHNPADFYGLSMILGGCEVNMWELAGTYSTLARILNRGDGNILSTDIHPPLYIKKPFKKGKPVNFPLDPVSVYFTFQAMQEVMRPGEEGLWQQFASSRKIAWKTGTSFGFRDAWAIGVTPKNVVAVWVGNADGEGRAGLVGVQMAAPVMFDIFRLLPDVRSISGQPDWFKKPVENYSYIPVCRQTGFRANIDCTETDTLYMPPHAGKSPLCPYHKIIHLDQNSRFRVTEQCIAPTDMKHISWFVLPATMEYYYKQHNHDYKVLPPLKENCLTLTSSKEMELVYPQTGSRIYVPLEISGQKGKAIFIATHRNKAMKIYWSIDESFYITTEG